MKREKDNRTENILNSLDGIKRMNAPDFFYTRLKAKMTSRQYGGQKIKVLRPVYAIALLILIIVFNVISFFRETVNHEQTANVNTESENTQTIASAYHLDDNSSSYELNQ